MHLTTKPTAAGPVPARRPTLPVLTGLRFVAALLVALEHFPELIPFNDGRPELVIQGGAGVSLFFVLSGFVLFYNYGDWFSDGLGRTGRFLRARLARIGPLHVLALVLITLLFIGRGDAFLRESSPATLAGAWGVNLLLLHAYVPAKILHSWNGPSWSISAELFFYLCFPLLIFVGRRRLGRGAGLGWLILIAYLIELALFVGVSGLAARAALASNPDVDGVRQLLNRFAYLPPLRIWEFLIGIALGAGFVHSRQVGAASWWRPLHDRRVRTFLLMTVGLAALTIQFLPGCLVPGCRAGPGWLAMLDFKLYAIYTPLSTLLIAALAWGPVFVSDWLRHRWLQLLGEASYSFYILQWLAWSLLHGPGSDQSPAPTWLFVITVIITLIISVFSYLYIEKPARQWLRGSST